MEFSCSICGYTSDTKQSVSRHLNRKMKCGDEIPIIIEKYVENICEFCSKKFNTKPSVTRHHKTCKVKKENLEEENKMLKDKLLGLESINKKYEEIKKINEELNRTNDKNEKIIDSIVKTSTKKILGNTPIETIRSQARKKYKDLFKNMKCVHCKHEGSTQVCHIKAISDFDKFSEIEEINKMSNLIGLCPNCHIDLDRHKKFEVTRTAILHSMLIHY